MIHWGEIAQTHLCSSKITTVGLDHMGSNHMFEGLNPCTYFSLKFDTNAKPLFALCRLIYVVGLPAHIPGNSTSKV